MEQPITLHVLSHTHWDREWHLTFEQFRMRLVDLIDHLLALLERDPEFLHFHLDAQTIVLEDYLEIRPQREELLKRLIAEKRIGVGPWYQLNDEFLTSAEATVRTLLVGNRIAKRFGHSLKLGYLPDQFGNISQMPQIFRGFGIDNCVFGRGWRLNGDRQLEFWWEGPDGSRVLTSFMAFWYNNAERFPADPDDAFAFTTRIRDAMAPHSATGQLLLMNGVDHFEPQDNLSPILEGLELRLQAEGQTILHSSFEQYIDALRPFGDKLGSFSGELREDWGGQCLAGTLSSRVYLKQANDRCQILLERRVEPSSVWAMLAGDPYPHDTLTYAWKLLMENHPHDSICGCSVDAVHSENETRFARVEQVGEELYGRALESLAARINTNAVETAVTHARSADLVVFNPTSFDRSDTVEAVIEFPLGDRTRGLPEIDRSRDVTALEIVDSTDTPVPFNLLDSRIAYTQYLSPTVLPLVAAVRRFTVRILARDVPGSGYSAYKALARRGSQPVAPNPCSSANLCLENEFFSIEADSGSAGIRVFDKKDERQYLNWHTIVSGGDVGDEYRYVAPLRDRVVAAAGPRTIALEETGPAGAELRIEYDLIVPETASVDETERSERTVTLPITTWIRLAPGSRRIEFRTRVTNRAKDHRLRVLFPTGVSTDHSESEGPFDVSRRPVRPPREWGPESSPFHPQQSWCDASDSPERGAVSGLAVLNRGLREYELLDDEDRTFAITLLRCVGRISGGGDAPGAALVPGAQCQGTYTFEYAVYPHEGNWESARVWREAHAFATPLRAIQTDSHDGSLPPVGRFLEISSPEFVVTAVKAAEPEADGEVSGDVIVRGYNITDRPLEGVTVRLRYGIGCALANLNEESEESIDVDIAAGAANLPAIGPRKIVTLRWKVMPGIAWNATAPDRPVS